MYYEADGVLDHVEGDPRAAFNQGRLCIRCLNQLEAIYGKDRVVHPMRRDPAKRGDDAAWEQCSWDEAYDLIEKNVRRIQKDYGPESIVGPAARGDVNCQLALTCYIAFKTPNLACGFLTGDSCMLLAWRARFDHARRLPCRRHVAVLRAALRRIQHEWPEVCPIWGNNPIVSNGDGFFGIGSSMRCAVAGTKLVVVASRGHLCLRRTPRCSCPSRIDAALAMADDQRVIGEDLTTMISSRSGPTGSMSSPSV